MKKIIQYLFFFTIPATVLLGCFPSGVEAASPSINQIRSVTYYPFPSHLGDAKFLSDFQIELPKIQAAGFNCIWFFIPWMDIEPNISPVTYNQAALTNLNAIISALNDRGMCAILPLDYLGVGWSPAGINSTRWMFDNNSFDAFKTYATTLASNFKSYNNVVFLLFSEGTWPSGDALNNSDLNQKFHDYINAVGWNPIWGTIFDGWQNHTLAEYNNSPLFFEWNDYEARSHLSTIVPLMKASGNTQMKIGYHWNVQVKIWANRLYTWNGNGPFDFMSFNLYPDNATCPNSSCINYLNNSISFFKSIEPTKPVFLGELGMSTYTWQPADILQFMPPILSNLQNKQMGFNMWMWKDFDPNTTSNKAEVFFGVVDINGNPKTMMSVIEPYLNHPVPGDLDGDTHVTDTDFQLFKPEFGKTGTGLKADFDGSGTVDIFDYNILVANFGK